LQQNVVEEEDKAEDENDVKNAPPKDKPDSCVPSHVVKTL